MVVKALIARRSRSPRLVPPFSFLHIFEHDGVIGRIGDDGNGLEILGGAANDRRPSDVDLLNGFRKCGVAGDGSLEGIEVYDNKVDGKEAVGLGLLFVFFVAAQVEEASVDPRMQSLDASPKDFGEACEFRDLDDGDALGL